MRLICRYSGVEFEASFFRNLKGNKRVVGEHPIMAFPTRELVKRVADWSSGNMSPNERRVFFVALLKSTGLVRKWEAAATPDDTLVQSYMQELVNFCYFKDAISSPQLAFPQIAITPATSDLRGIGTWLKLWNSEIQEWRTGYVKSNIAKKLETREATLTRLIKSSLLRNPAHYRNVLASWAMEAAQVPSHLRETFSDIMKVDPSSSELFAYTLPDIEQVVEYMEVHLTAGSIHTHAVLSHVRELWQRNKYGMNYHLGIPSDEVPDYAALSATPFRIVEDEVETFNKEVIAEAAPEKEPQKHDFGSDTARYMLAKMRWRIAQQQKEDREKLAKMQEDMLRKRADRITNIVDSNEDAEELPDG
jgi:hypothetical protein